MAESVDLLSVIGLPVPQECDKAAYSAFLLESFTKILTSSSHVPTSITLVGNFGTPSLSHSLWDERQP